ncbi:MAG: 4'-phosphopantetheinyl transferase superfamily protein [Bacteroidota bacterium]
MAFYQSIEIKPKTNLYLWKITEDFNTLFREVKLKDVSLARLEAMKSESHQKGFIAVRMLLQHLGYSDFDLYYDEYGKPHLKDGKHLSISHSNGYSGIVVSDKNVGLDIEQLKEKTLRIASRFMDISHLENLSETEQIKKATVIWGIKETIFKVKNEVGISFIDHIFENDFAFDDKKATVELHFNNKIEFFEVVFDSVEDYVYVCAFQKE